MRSDEQPRGPAKVWSFDMTPPFTLPWSRCPDCIGGVTTTAAGPVICPRCLGAGIVPTASMPSCGPQEPRGATDAPGAEASVETPSAGDSRPKPPAVDTELGQRAATGNAAAVRAEVERLLDERDYWRNRALYGEARLREREP